MAALDPVAFLRSTRPFDELPPDLFRRASASIEIGFSPTGTRLAERGGTPLQHLYVIRKGAVRLRSSALLNRSKDWVSNAVLQPWSAAVPTKAALWTRTSRVGAISRTLSRASSSAGQSARSQAM